jgi:hypothetical protein
MNTEKTIKTVKSMIENKHLAKLSEGKAHIRWLKNKFSDTSVEIDVNEQYDLFLKDHPEYK